VLSHTQVVGVTFFAALIDFMGTVIVMPMLPGLCFYAEGGPAHIDTLLSDWTCSDVSAAAGACDAEKQATYEAMLELPEFKEIVNPHAYKDLDLPFSMSIELPLAVGQFFSAVSSFLAGRVIDKVGAKIPIMICLGMGLVGYLLVYAGAIWIRNYWLLAVGLWVNSFFGVVMDIAATSAASS
jgi:MFS family permease